MNKPPAFQFYAADFVMGIAEFSDEDAGAYIRMLCFQWTNGSLPADPLLIKKAVNSSKKPSKKVLEKFEMQSDGRLRNPRLEAERQKQLAFRESRVNGGKARSKGASICNAHAEHMQSITPALQSSSSSSDSNDAIAPPSEETAFAVFWDAYPRKVNKLKASQKWARMPEAKRKAAIEGVHRLSPSWSPGFEPHPTTYLNGERWTDEQPGTGQEAPIKLHYAEETRDEGAFLRQQLVDQIQAKALEGDPDARELMEQLR